MRASTAAKLSDSRDVMLFARAPARYPQAVALRLGSPLLAALSRPCHHMHRTEGLLQDLSFLAD